nr:copia protein [Tanacetum cinerariifolium]
MPPRRNKNIYDVYERIMERMKERLDQFVDQFANRMNDTMNPRRRGDRNDRRSEDEESENPFFEGDGSSLFVEREEWEDDRVADDDYEEGSVFDDDQCEKELMLVYDTTIEDVIEEEERFVRKGGFSGEEDNSEDVVVVANDLCSSMIQTSISVDFSKTVDSNPHELIWLQKGDESYIVAMQEELNQFVANDVWELVPQPKNMKIKGTKWVFRNNLDKNGIVSQNKARLESIRILLAYACALDFKLFQMDVKGAFLNGFINEEGTDIETVVYADSDHARNYVDRKSTSGICTFVGCCLTYWFSKKLTALAISTTDVEYVTTGKACQQALWMKQALIDYDVLLDDFPIMRDNKGVIDLSKNPVQYSRTKHIEIRQHFLCDNVQKGHISIEKVSSVDNITNILTKPLKPFVSTSPSSFVSSLCFIPCRDNLNTSSKVR